MVKYTIELRENYGLSFKIPSMNAFFYISEHFGKYYCCLTKQDKHFKKVLHAMQKFQAP